MQRQSVSKRLERVLKDLGIKQDDTFREISVEPLENIDYYEEEGTSETSTSSSGSRALLPGCIIASPSSVY